MIFLVNKSFEHWRIRKSKTKIKRREDQIEIFRKSEQKTRRRMLIIEDENDIRGVS